MLYTDKPILMVYARKNNKIDYLAREATDDDIWGKQWTGGEYGTELPFLVDLPATFPIESYNMLVFFVDLDKPAMYLRVMRDGEKVLGYKGVDAYGQSISGDDLGKLLLSIDPHLQSFKFEK